MFTTQAEYLIRLSVCPSYRRFFFDFFNTIDLLAMLPTYIGLIVIASSPSGTSAKAIVEDLRLLRLTRLLKLAKTYSGIHIFFLAMSRSLDAVGMLIFFLSFATILFSAVLWYSERGNAGTFATDGFYSIPASLWWGIVTIATVGYGDIVPR